MNGCEIISGQAKAIHAKARSRRGARENLPADESLKSWTTPKELGYSGGNLVLRVVPEGGEYCSRGEELQLGGQTDTGLGEC
jgi:hypothetical protein